MMSYKRGIVVFLLLLVSFGAIFAEDSDVVKDDVDSNIYEVNTEHFTIIYDKSTEESAAIIADCCEDSYDYLVSLFKTDPELYLPVVLTSSVKMLNANFASYPANRIYLYDVIADQGSLTSFPETLSYIFKHELTHAFTMNFRSSFWQVLANIFADSVSPSNILYSFQSLTEGIAVAVESLDGYGRMNDYASTRIVRQAKIEGKFPSWLQICGARDTYPSSLLPYIFGGSFLTYLFDTYGSDKVAEIFVRFGKINWFKDTTKIIESVIGEKMDTLWNDFYLSIEVPFEVETGSAVEGYTKTGVFTGFKALSDGSVMFRDTATYSLYKLSADTKTSTKVMSDLSYADSSYDVSDDGLILIPMVLELSNYVQIKSQDGKTIKTFNYDDRDVKGGAFVKDGLVLYTAKAQQTFLEVYDSNYESKGTISLGSGVVASGFANLKDGRLAFIRTVGVTDNIAILDTSDLSVEVYENPTSMRLYNLALSYETGESILSFGWMPTASSTSSSDTSAENDSPILGGYGEFNYDDGSFRLSKVDVNGGVNYPVRLQDTVLYSSSLYEGDVINSISIEDLDLEDAVVTSHSKLVEKTFDTEKLKALSNAKVYDPFDNMTSSMLIPSGYYLDGQGGTGLTWSAADPTETYGFNMTGMCTEAGFSLGVWGVLNTGLGSLSVGSLVSSRDVNFSVLAQPSYSFYFDAGKVLTVSDQAFYNLSLSENGKKRSFTNSFAVSYSSATSTGLGVNKTIGYKISFGLTNTDPSLALTVKLPFYFPVTLKGSAYYDVSSKFVELGGQGKLTLLSFEVQDGTRILGLYVKRFIVDFAYDCRLLNSVNDFNQTLSLRAYAEIAPLIGMLASVVDLKLGVQLSWNPAEGTPAVTFALIED